MTNPFGVRALRRVANQLPGSVRKKVLALYAVLIAFNAGAWGLAILAFWRHPALLGTALIAYGFGLRHAVDADHISAIDNVTRKLMQDGRRPVGVGFFFSLGHSTIVVALTVAIAIAAGAVGKDIPGLQSVGGLVGTSISALFLLLIAALNLVVFVEILGTLRKVRRGSPDGEARVDALPAGSGLMARLFRPLFRIVTDSRQMYPVGVLFGLGFDTASEVGLLGIAAVEAGKGLPVLAILIFPLLFTAGMSLLDTTDGILMLGAYGWAFVEPLRKLYYNLVITLVSVVVAVVVGGIEVAGLLGTTLNRTGGFWDQMNALNGNFGLLGFGIVTLFAASWLVAALLYRRASRNEAPALVREPS